MRSLERLTLINQFVKSQPCKTSFGLFGSRVRCT